MTHEQWQTIVSTGLNMAQAAYFEHCGGQDETAARSAATEAFMAACMEVQP